MIVVSDTTPIISLLKINHLGLLHQLFGEVWIPAAVYEELIFNDKFKQEAELICKTEYIKKVIVEDLKSVALLKQNTRLDIGESEAIILSNKMKADLLLMDEAKGRLVAEQMGLNIMGTIGMLMTAFEENLLSAAEIEQCVEVLKKNGRHISSRLYAQLIEKMKSK